MATPENAPADKFICGWCDQVFHSLEDFSAHKTMKCTPSGIPVPTLVTIEPIAPKRKRSASTEPTSNVKTRPRLVVPTPRTSVGSEQASIKVKTFTRGADGSYVCEACTHTFHKVRHFRTHKCMAHSDYLAPTLRANTRVAEKPCRPSATAGGRVSTLTGFPAGVVEDRGESDISIPDLPSEVLEYESSDSEGTEGTDIELDSDLSSPQSSSAVDSCQDLPSPSAVKRPRGRPRKNAWTSLKECEARTNDGADVATPSDDPMFLTAGCPKSKIRKGKRKIKCGPKRRVLADYVTPMCLDDIPDVPVFATHSDRVQFEEEVLSKVDLSIMDDKYRTHAVKQLVTTSRDALTRPGRRGGELAVFQCNTCEKLFKTVSHVRLHCLSHTDIRPFKCHLCDYATNSKGNLYTHMRTHTGRLFWCGTCDYAGVSKSHLLQHETVHSTVRFSCDLCPLDPGRSGPPLKFRSMKSLKYHMKVKHGKTGPSTTLLGKALPKHKAPTSLLLHSCHVCSRRFKKSSDRDRHLLIHNMQRESGAFECPLCPAFLSTRRAFLEDHIKARHPLVFICCVCSDSDRRQSSVVNSSGEEGARFVCFEKLCVHLVESHTNDNVDQESLQRSSVEMSLFLPSVLQTAGFSIEGITELQRYLSKPATKEKPITITSLPVLAKPTGEQEHFEPECALVALQDSIANTAISSSNSRASSDQIQTVYIGDFSHEVATTPPVQLSQGNIEASVGNTASSSLDLSEVYTKVRAVATSGRNHTTSTLLDSLSIFNESHQPSGKAVRVAPETVHQEDVLSTAATIAGLSSSFYTSSSQEPSIVNTNNPSVAGITSPAIHAANSGSVSSGFSRGAVTITGSEGLSIVAHVEVEASREQDEDWFTKLGYQILTWNIYVQLRNVNGSLECGDCPRLFDDGLELEEHMAVHNSERPFPCPQAGCPFRSFNKAGLKLHIEKVHECQEVHLRCSHCSFTARTSSQLIAHYQQHADSPCPKCELVLKGKKELRNHLLSHPGVTLAEARNIAGYGRRVSGNPNYKCPYCSKVFLHNMAELQRHISCHENTKPFRCVLCNYSCRSKSNLESHMMRHSDLMFSCQICAKEYKSKTALRWHVRSHANGKLFKCSRCPYEGYQESHLKRHMETHTVVKKFICEYCDYSCNTLGYMRNHYTRHHTGAQFMRNSGKPKHGGDNVKTFKCMSCDYLFGNMSDIKRHLRVKHHMEVSELRHVSSEEVPMESMPAELAPMSHPTERAIEIARPEVETTAHTAPPYKITDTSLIEANLLQQLSHQAALVSPANAVTSDQQQEQTVILQTANQSQEYILSTGEAEAASSDSLGVGSIVAVSSLESGPAGGGDCVIRYVTEDGTIVEGTVLDQSEQQVVQQVIATEEVVSEVTGEDAGMI